MSFADVRFLVFFPVVTALYVLLPQRYRWMFLLVASYFFYMLWRPEYGLLLALITVIDFTAAILIGRAHTEVQRRIFLIASLVANLGLLFYFKYLNFVLSSFQEVLAFAGNDISFPVLNILLPIGISFHIFQSMSYTIDVYRRRVEPVRHLGKFALYVSFFPQLVAGPIERPQGLLKQIMEGRAFDLAKAKSGTKLMFWGFFKKLVIADNLAPLVNAAYASPENFPGPTLAFATVLFAYQIYCDFSGYTDIARGSARILGYDLMLNFNRPFHATSLTDFWNRWHISLSTWLRDYLYYPLALRGKNHSRIRIYSSVFITLVLIGLWHGANWTYVLFGAIHGVYLVVGTATLGMRNLAYRRFWKPFGRMAPPTFLKTLTVFAMVCFSYIFFRAETTADALFIIERIPQGGAEFLQGLWSIEGIKHVLGMDVSLSGQWGSMLLPGIVVAILGILFMELIEWLHAHGNLSKRLALIPYRWRLVLFAVGGFTIMTFGGFATPQQFIYFQF